MGRNMFSDSYFKKYQASITQFKLHEIKKKSIWFLNSCLFIARDFKFSDSYFEIVPLIF